MTANLPPGFDPGVWGEGWELDERYPYVIFRRTHHDHLLSVRYGNGQWHVQVGIFDYSHFNQTSESEAAAFANTYAESHGGWMVPQPTEPGEGEKQFAPTGAERETDK